MKKITLKGLEEIMSSNEMKNVTGGSNCSNMGLYFVDELLCYCYGCFNHSDGVFDCYYIERCLA